jgi:hypothetical protein
MESTDTISFCKTGTKINTLSAKNVAHKKTGEDLNLCAYDGSIFNPIITINNNNQDCRIMTNLNIAGNLNIIGNGIINTSLGIGTTSLNNGFTSSNVHTNSILDINGQTTIRGHILPSVNAQFDLGNAEYKIRHLFLSDNSLWIGDKHKIDVTDGTIKFRKRKTKTIPTSIDAIKGGDDDAAIQLYIKNKFEHSENPAISDIKLEEWHAYAQSKQANIKIEDIFKPGIEGDWDENDTTMDKLVIKKNIDVSGNVNITKNLNVSGNINLTNGEMIQTTGNGSFGSLRVYNSNYPSTTGRPLNPKEGEMRYNTDFKTYEFWNSMQWIQLLNISSPVQWEILMFTNSNKSANAGNSYTTQAAFGKLNSIDWLSTNNITSGARDRWNFTHTTPGLFNAFFNKKNITKIAIVDGSTNSFNPTDHTNYVIFDLVTSTGHESIYDILYRLENYLESHPNNSNTLISDTFLLNSSPGPSVSNITCGVNGYSGLRTMQGGTWSNCEKFCIYGINLSSDNDWQSLCVFSGHLGQDSNKGDSWRGSNPNETFWSYAGGDFNTHPTQRGHTTHVSSYPGVSTDHSPTNIFLMAF